MDPETALLVAATAAVLGQVLGALLTFVGSLINDYFARRREQREQDRQKREREEQQAKEEKMFAAQERSRVYKTFVIATTYTLPVIKTNLDIKLVALNESYTEIQILASEEVRTLAQELYKEANENLNAQQDPSYLDPYRDRFWDGVRRERESIHPAAEYMSSRKPIYGNPHNNAP